MLSWDIGKLYSRFVHLDEDTIAECPLGALYFMVTEAVSKYIRGEASTTMPSLVWADELTSALLLGGGSGADPSWLERWLASGWNAFFMMSHLRQHMLQSARQHDKDAPCVLGGESTFIGQVEEMVQGGPAVSLPVCSAFLAALDWHACEIGGGASHNICCLPRSLGYFALADSVGVMGHSGDREKFLRMGSEALQAGLLSASGSGGGALLTLVRSPWPIVDSVDRHFQVPYMDLTVNSVIRRALKQEPFGRLAEPGAERHTFRMMIFPRREIVSDMIRFSRLPFCGMLPFMHLVERIAAARADACQEFNCSLSFVEGGPHLGDCTLWATAAFDAVGIHSFAVAYEPLPDASSLFRESVRANSWDSRVNVVPRALAAEDGETVRLAYYPGHNGESTTVRAAAAHCGDHCAGFSEIPTITLDHSWPSLRPARLDILKLSVNGEELNVLRGSRKLLARRQVCSILVHVTKAARGFNDAAGGNAEGNDFSREMWDLLTQTAGMEVWLHLDKDLTGQVAEDDLRERPQTRQLHAAADLAAVLGRSASPHDYLISRQSNLTQSSPCADSLALRHWDEVF